MHPNKNNTKPNPAFVINTGELTNLLNSFFIDFPFINISPSSKSWIPTIALISVVLPAPLCPINANISPSSTLNETLFNAIFSPYFFLHS